MRYFKDAKRKLPNGITKDLICAQDNNVTRRSDACHGDSGGPLLSCLGIEYLYGVVAFGRSVCGGSSAPGVYTSVYEHLDWIESIVWPNLV